MHVSYISQVLLVPRCLTYCLPPFLYGFQDLHLNPGRPYGWSFGEASNKLIEEFFGGYLEMEGIAAVLDANVKQLCSNQQVVQITEASGIP